MLPAVFAISGVPRHYGWGSRTAIPQLLGEPPSDRPVAELWFGAHADDPSAVPAHDDRLDVLIAADPSSLLGPETAQQFGGTLPFLLKILAAEHALSIQVHPTRAQAVAGYAAENEAGVALDAPNRNYRDRNHKPELLYALTPFEALCGFRSSAEILARLDRLAVPELAFLREALSGPDGLRAAFTALLEAADPDRLVAAVLQAPGRQSLDEGTARALTLTARDFPGDIGIVLTLLLNYVRLDAGEAIYLEAGNVHAYLRGTGVEIMANSDNVLRCGLTPKHIDVPALLAVTDFTPLSRTRWPADDGRFVVPVPDFALWVVEPSGAEVVSDDPRAQIVLCTTGHVRVSAGAAEVELSPGGAAFVRAGSGFSLGGHGQACCASVGER